MQAVLARLDSVNPAVNACVTVARESALAEARRATAGLKRGRTLPLLHGVPVSIKDLTPTKGIRTTWGSKVHEHDVPTEDSLVVQRLKAAGAIVFAKTNTPEFGAGGNTFNAVFGATRNPWDPALTCGGSSGGAAVALATGIGPIAQGSDLGRLAAHPRRLLRRGGLPHHARARARIPQRSRLGLPLGDGPDGAHGDATPRSCSPRWRGPTTARRCPTTSTPARSRARRSRPPSRAGGSRGRPTWTA